MLDLVRYLAWIDGTEFNRSKKGASGYGRRPH
jgi:hypothetical protein